VLFRVTWGDPPEDDEDDYFFWDEEDDFEDHFTLIESRNVENDGIEELTQRLEGMDLLGQPVVTPTEFKLVNVYPNPFNSRTSITCDIPERAHLSLKVLDISGREVCSLAEKTLNAGSHIFNFSAETLPSGLYYCRMEAGSYKQTIKLALIR